MLVKKIHYCWFGGNKLPKLAKKCIKSWKKHFPDYEIVEWNENNFDVNCCNYVKQAYSQKKYAFVSDYARFKILHDEGGIYFDTDVEVVKSFADIIKNGGFLGIEKNTDRITIAPGLGFGANKNSKVLEELLDIYKNLEFTYKDVKTKTIVDITTEYFESKGLKQEDCIQNIEDITIYPKEYFNPCNMDTGMIKITPNTHSIHHYAASWVSDYSRLRGKVFKIMNAILGEKISNFIRKVLGRRK